MSAETIEWLNQNTLIGFENTKGKAWHFSAAAQADEANHYPEAIPVEDVNRRLFHWEILSAAVTATVPVIDENGVGEQHIAIPNKQALLRSDDNTPLGLMSDSYRVHQYPEWLVDNVGTLLDAGEGEVGIGSAGLLQNGAVAWVQVQRPEGIEIGGEAHHPFLTAATSCNGTLASTYKSGDQRAVCDNTLDIALRSGRGGVFKVRHTSQSLNRIDEAREALEIAFLGHAQFETDVEALMNEKIAPAQFKQILDIVVSVPTEEGRGQTMAKDRQTDIRKMYALDPRVGEFQGTAWGVLQVFNTHRQHEARVTKTTNRTERNRMNFLTGKTGQSDREVLDIMTNVVGRELLPA